MTDDSKPKGGRLTIGGEFSTTDESPAARLTTPNGGPVPDLPLRRVLVVGDFAPGAGGSGPHPIDKSSFADTLSRIAARVSLTIDHPLEPGKLLGVELGFSSIKDFAPDALAERVPVVNRLLALRKTAARFHEGGASAGEVAAAADGLELPASIRSLVEGVGGPSNRTPAARRGGPRSSTIANPVDSLLDLIDTGGAPDAEPNGDSPLDGLIEAIGERAGGQNRAGAEPLMHAIDPAIGRSIDAVLGDPAFRAVEAAWRSLKLIVDRTDFRRGVRLSLLACARGEVAESITEAAFRSVWNRGETAYDLIVVLHPFGRAPEEIETLSELAIKAASTQTLIACWAAPAFFGVRTGADLASIPSFSDLLSGPEYEKWRAFREGEDAGWLALAVGDVRLRDAFRTGGTGARAFDYTERTGAEGPPAGPAAAVLACALTGLLADLGTDDPAARSRPAQIDDLPVGVVDGGGAAASAVLSRSAVEDLADCGLCAVAAKIDTPSVLIPSMVTAQEGGPSAPQALVTGLISRYALTVARALGEMGEPAAADVLRTALARVLFPATANVLSDHLAVEAEPNAEAPGERIYLVRVQPPYRIYGHAITAEFGFSI